jgi:hypothetical protein
VCELRVRGTGERPHANLKMGKDALPRSRHAARQIRLIAVTAVTISAVITTQKHNTIMIRIRLNAAIRSVEEPFRRIGRSVTRDCRLKPARGPWRGSLYRVVKIALSTNPVGSFDDGYG